MKSASAILIALLLSPLVASADVRVETVMVSMRDGVNLATDIYRGDTTNAAPVVLMRTPYNKDRAKGAAERFAVAGYVAVVQDCRGKFASEGVFIPYNKEGQDGFDAIEWIGNQPWCNGRIGMWGSSYVGATQWQAAVEHPPKLVTFIADDTPDAFAKLIGRLLDSPRYCERWGRHWLDIARYADTHGGSAIGFTKFPFSNTYRDYVINSLNADVPYDRFVTEQLAADQLGLAENDPALAGLGFLTVGMQFRNPHDVIDDQIDVVTRGLMGLTVACARCHDHKYDPIPTTDYYALYATLAASETPEMLPIVGHPPAADAYRQYQKELTRRQTIHQDMARDQTEVMRGRLRMQIGLYLRELAKGTPEQDLSAAFLSYRTDDLRPLVLNRWRNYLAEMPADDLVFGLWLQLAALPDEDFATRCSTLVEAWTQENGDPAKFANLQNLSTAAPKWNPRVLEALTQKHPTSLLDVADAYGSLFADVQRQRMVSLLEASLDGAAGAEIVPDQDARHEAINSAVNSQRRRHLHEPGTPTSMPDELATTLLNRTVRDNLGGKRGAIHNLQLSSPGSPPRAMVLEERIPEQPFHVFRRGNPIDRGEVVEAQFLTALTAATTEPAPFPDGQRRLALARCVVDPNNPLLPRVLVNWVWQHHFGRGLVITPDDFGARSQPPTHPLLLDYLAVSFQEDGWSLKKLHKRIMLSDVYQQAAIENADSREKDPDNHLLWRMPHRRMEMETMGDSTLAVSGEMNVSTIGGRPFDFLSAPVVPRRSVYGFVNRDIISSLASTFDGANATSCTAKRSETTVPQQTLFDLNSVFIQDRAAAFSKICANIEDAEQRVRFMYRQAVENPVSVHDLHATMLHQLGYDHKRLTYRFAGRDFRLTDVHGEVIREILA